MPLDRPLWWLGGARHGDLYADPLPAWESPLPGSWARVQHAEEPLLESARSVATWHLVHDLVENRSVRDTQDGTPELPLLLGDRCLAVTSGPYRDDRPPRWAGAVDYALHNVSWAADELQAGLWPPGPVARQAAADLHPTLASAPDSPALPDTVTETTWIQRAVRLAHLQATIRTVREHYGQGSELDGHPGRPFGSVLTSTMVALGTIEDTVHELEAL
ncbi:hypothetical protein [Streptomyces klenkii]|uniref:hypothetical protein n=1 Tax=Streptomyces klenkii TaxID=1420899 RepID=UPI0034486F9C